MSNGKYQYPQNENYGVICRGDNGSPASQQDSTAGLYNPVVHSSDIDESTQPYCITRVSPNQFNLELFTGPPEKGTVVTYEGQQGDPNKVITGMISTGITNRQSVAGNDSLTKVVNKLASATTADKNKKPKVVDKNVDGALVRQIQEVGSWFHNLTNGIAPHAAWNPIAGQFLKEMKQIETALQSFASIPNAGALAQLPGSIMNLASLLKGLNNNQKSRATQNMSPQVAQAFDSMANLMPDDDASGLVSGRINPEVFTENMIQLLSQVNNLSDLIDIMYRLQYDETIRGLDSYAKTAETGLLAETALRTAVVTEDDEEVSYLLLDKTVGKSTVYFTEGYSINVNNQTYVVISAEQDSNEITVFPKVEGGFIDQKVRVYLPVAEFEVEGPYGPMTMEMDMNGNIKPNKNSAQKLQQAMQVLQGIMQLCPAAKNGKSLFGDAAGIMSQLFNRIQNPQVRSMLQNIATNSSADPTKVGYSISQALKGVNPGLRRG
jgi:hypothetical protein